MYIPISKILSKKFNFNNSEESIPRLDLELLISKAISKDRVFVLTNQNYQLEGKELMDFNSLLKRRKSYEPLAYIIGEKEFYGLTFEVNSNVLIPRPETEELVDVCVEKIIKSKKKKLNILEIGAGSGAISISTLWSLQNKSNKIPINITAIDISKNALEIAEKNKRKYQLDNKNYLVKFIEGDIFDKDIYTKLQKDSFDMIISNPPYIPTEEISGLQNDVKSFEPLIALDGGKDGMNFYKHILNNFSFDSQTLIFEIHSSKKTELEALVNELAPNKSYKFINDLSAKPRILVIE